MKVGLDLSALEQTSRTGVERYALELGRALDELEGVAVSGYARRSLRPEPDFTWTRLGSSLPRPWWRTLRLSFAAQLDGLQHLHSPTSAPLKTRGFTRSRCIHDLGFLDSELKGEEISAWRRRRIRASLAQDIPTVFPSRATELSYRAHFPDSSAPSAVIHHGIEDSLVDDDVLPMVLPDSVPAEFALVLGTRRSRRQPELLAQYFRVPLSGLSLVWAGDEADGESLGPKSDSSVVCLGRVDDRTRRALLDRAVLLIMPSRVEGFGLPALEALARRCPVLAHDLPVYEETLGQYGECVDFGDEAAFLAGLSRALAWTDEYREAGRRHAEVFTWRRSAEAHLAFFRSLA